MKWPASLEEAFDLHSHTISEEEVERVREAVRLRRVRFSPHATNQRIDRGISAGDVISVILNQPAVSKDLPNNNLDRKPGLNFQGKAPSRIEIRVKVTWLAGYVVATTHEIEPYDD